MITRMYVGIDVSKNWFDVCTSPEASAKAIRYSNDAAGFNSFIASVKDLARKHYVCMEHTGGYETALALVCKQACFAVSIIDGAALASYRRSFGIAKSKTDSQDARLLSLYCKDRKPALWYPLPDEYRTLRELVRHREDLLSAKTAWACRSAVGVESELVTAHKRALVEVLRLQVEAVEKAIQAHVRAHEKLLNSVELLCTIPGIAACSASKILAESGPISGYSSARDYALAAGLVPIACMSGMKTPAARLPVYGNRELRSALYFPVVVCYGKHIGVWEFMRRAESKGSKLKMTVITAGMRKLSHVVWGVLKHQQPYDHRKL